MITIATVRQKVVVLANRTGLNLYVERAYGLPRLQLRIDRGETGIGPRVKTRELDSFIEGMHAMLDLQQGPWPKIGRLKKK